MFRNMSSLALAVALLPLTALARTPLDAAIAADQDGPLYSFDVHYQNTGMSAHLKIDPSLPEGERLSVISPDESEWNEDFKTMVAKRRKRSDGDIWCHKLSEHIPEDARLASETDTTATYTFTPLPTDEVEGDRKKMFSHLTGTVVVDKNDPAILSFRMAADKPFKPMALAKIQEFDMSVTCERAPDGRTHISTMDLTVNGSALMQSFTQSDHQRVSNLTRVDLPESTLTKGTETE